jgi:hypothetical protein
MVALERDEVVEGVDAVELGRVDEAHEGGTLFLAPPPLLGGYRPPSCKGDAGAVECWFQVEDLAQIFETCWSPFVNPSGKKWVDCEIVRDPSQRPAE